jgi:hypothetical protein
MCNTITLKRGISYDIVDGPPAGELKETALRAYCLQFVVESHSGTVTVLVDITAITKRNITTHFLFVVGIQGRIWDKEQEFLAVYDPSTRTGEFCLI